MDEDRKDYCRQLPVVRRLCRASWYGHDVFHGICFEFYAGNLSKPVIFTGSQLPIGMLRTDGKENLITAIEIAAAKENGVPVVPEVCIFSK